MTCPAMRATWVARRVRHVRPATRLRRPGALPRQPIPAARRLRVDLSEEGIELDVVEKELIWRALQRFGCNRTRAAQFLNLSRGAISYRCRSMAYRESSCETWKPFPEVSPITEATAERANLLSLESRTIIRANQSMPILMPGEAPSRDQGKIETKNVLGIRNSPENIEWAMDSPSAPFFPIAIWARKCRHFSFWITPVQWNSSYRSRRAA